VGTILAIFGGAWKLYANNMEGLELHSVGHSNHSAAYLCIIFGLALAFLAGFWRSLVRRDRWLLSIAMIICGFAIVATASRVAVVCMALVALLIGAMHLRQSWKPLAFAAGMIGVAALLLTAVDPWVLRKHVRNLNEDNLLAYRDQIWERATTAWRAYPVFGIGMDNFARITTERYRSWTEAQGRVFDPTRVYTSSHAHSLYLDTLSERGIVGTAALVAFLAGWAVSLWRRRPNPREWDPFGMTVWGAGAAALFVMMFIGLVNTTLHDEQFAASMLCLGGWLAWCRRRR
jgi:O-antigen ligase